MPTDVGAGGALAALDIPVESAGTNAVVVAPDCSSRTVSDALVALAVVAVVASTLTQVVEVCVGETGVCLGAGL